ncbi:Fatty acyl-CoA reductase 2, variant 2 [Trebouxia sp. C0010 RCD-2024]
MTTPYAGQYSVREAFEGSTVLITGATGYIGGLVLEQLLRVGRIGKAYLVIRTKKGESQQQRLKTLLSGPVFRLHHGTDSFHQIMGKVEVIPGDLAQPQCGISIANQKRLLPDVQYVIHAAASIQFDNPIHTDLTLSYIATKAIADFAAKMKKLRCFMYVSTAYSNAHLKKYSTVKEQLYPLREQDGQEVDHAAVVDRLLAMPVDEAQQEVQSVMKRLNFNHTNYGFCKNLTEQMLAGYHLNPFPVCISRPVSVGCVAKGPCPGYVGNTSGATGIILSIACGIGTFQSRTPNLPYTLVPGDVASSVIVASMAATAAGQGSQKGPNITQSCTSCSNPISLRQLTDHICEYYRQDPPSKDQFGDGKYEVHWTQDLEEYERWWQKGTTHTQQLARQLEEEGRMKSAARVRTAWKVWRTWSNGGGETGLRFDDSMVQHQLAPGLVDREKGNVLLTFTPEATGVSWPAYVHLYCAGAKQLFFHEKPKMPLQLEPVTLSSL